MQKYKSMTRTTLDSLDGAPRVGLYVIAYMGAILYVGKASTSVVDRIESHIRNCDPVGVWMRSVDDWPNVRVDILEAPADSVNSWLIAAESALIRQFLPLFNRHVHV